MIWKLCSSKGQSKPLCIYPKDKSKLWAVSTIELHSPEETWINTDKSWVEESLTGSPSWYQLQSHDRWFILNLSRNHLQKSTMDDVTREGRWIKGTRTLVPPVWGQTATKLLRTVEVILIVHKCFFHILLSGVRAVVKETVVLSWNFGSNKIKLNPHQFVPLKGNKY